VGISQTISATVIPEHSACKIVALGAVAKLGMIHRSLLRWNPATEINLFPYTLGKFPETFCDNLMSK